MKFVLITALVSLSFASVAKGEVQLPTCESVVAENVTGEQRVLQTPDELIVVGTTGGAVMLFSPEFADAAGAAVCVFDNVPVAFLAIKSATVPVPTKEPAKVEKPSFKGTDTHTK